MRWLVGIIGFVLVFVGVFLSSGLLLAWLFPKALAYQLILGEISTNNPVGLVLGLLAGVHSFRASIRKKAPQKANKVSDGNG